MLVTAKNAGNMSQCTYDTRFTCLKGADKDKWFEAEFDMLDKHDLYRMYGASIKKGKYLTH
jgi:hypothetical protein